MDIRSQKPPFWRVIPPLVEPQGHCPPHQWDNPISRRTCCLMVRHSLSQTSGASARQCCPKGTLQTANQSGQHSDPDPDADCLLSSRLHFCKVYINSTLTTAEHQFTFVTAQYQSLCQWCGFAERTSCSALVPRALRMETWETHPPLNRFIHCRQRACVCAFEPLYCASDLSAPYCLTPLPNCRQSDLAPRPLWRFLLSLHV